MDELSRQILKQAINISDEDLEKLTPGLRKLVSDLPAKTKWKIIAEVTESKYCFAGLKPGDKFVFNYPVLSIAESTATPCVEAIASLASHLSVFVDRVAEGVDPNDSIRAGRQFGCPDGGLEHGGLGKVWFKLYAEKRE